MRSAWFLLILTLLVTLTGCGSSAARGDVDGVAVPFDVLVTRAYANNLASSQARVSAGVGMGFGSHGHTRTGLGIGLGFSATTITLRGGSNPGGSDVFRKRIGWGDQQFSVPLRPGRICHLTVVVSGGRNGVDRIGSIEADPNQVVVITLDETGYRLETTPLADPGAESTPAAVPEPAPTAPVSADESAE